MTKTNSHFSKVLRMASAPPCWLPLLVLTILTATVHFLDLDLIVAEWFRSPAGQWRFKHLPGIVFLYQFGCWPAWAMAISAGMLSLASFLSLAFRPYCVAGLFLAMAVLIGPGLLVNGVLKPHYGRPRPRDVLEFGGKNSFQPAIGLRWNSPGRSFPSGQAAMGFVWLAPAIYCWNERRWRGVVFGILALINGAALSFGRMAQGAHWFSDVLWSRGWSIFPASHCLR